MTDITEQYERPWKNAPGAPVEQEGDTWIFRDSTECCGGGIEVNPHDGYWPATVKLEIDAGTLLPDDARALGKALIEAADRADELGLVEEEAE